jgi:hypothetical protein
MVLFFSYSIEPQGIVRHPVLEQVLLQTIDANLIKRFQGVSSWNRLVHIEAS